MTNQIKKAVAFSLWSMVVASASAQSKAPGLPEGTQLNPGRVAPGHIIVSGCVQREAQGAASAFVLRDTRETPPLQYRLDGDTALLALHVGHTVEISGPPTTPPDRSNLTGLRVQSLTYISTTCSKPK